MELVGRQFGNYQIQKLIGEGAQADVYLAYDKTGRKVALKIMKLEHLGRTDLRERFIGSTKIATGIHHRHIIQTYEVSEFDIDGRTYPYIAMRYIQGGTLEERLHQQGRLSVGEACRAVVHMCHALEQLHQRGIVHRDIKPSNILYRAEKNEYILTDFGITKELNAATPLTVVGGAPIGTLEYMSPEQVSGEEITPAADIYALGAVLYHLVVGRFPWAKDSPGTAIMYFQRSTLYPSVRESDPSLPAWLDFCIGKATAKEPAQRYPSALAFGEDLQRYLNAPVNFPAPPVPPAAVVGQKKQSLAAVVGVLGVLALVIMGVVFVAATPSPSVTITITSTPFPIIGAPDSEESEEGSTTAVPIETPLEQDPTSTVEVVSPANSNTTPRTSTPRPNVTRATAVTPVTPTPSLAIRPLFPIGGSQVRGEIDFRWEGSVFAESDPRTYTLIVYRAGSDEEVRRWTRHKQPNGTYNLAGRADGQVALFEGSYEWVVRVEGGSSTVQTTRQQFSWSP